MTPSGGSASLGAVRMTKRYRGFLPEGSRIINYAVKATGRDCDLCGHTPQQLPPKPGYEIVSEEMRLMRVTLPEGVTADQVSIGRKDFTVTGTLIELNVCVDVQGCRNRCADLIDEETGEPKYPPTALQLLRAG